MTAKPIIIFGNKSKTQENHICISEKDFQVLALDYKINLTAINEIQRIETSNLNDKLVLELFQYNDGISLWWLLHNQLFNKFHNVISFILKFSEFLDKQNPSSIIIENEYEMIEIIKQICNQKKIKLEYSNIGYKKYKIKNKTKSFSRNKGVSVILEHKIKNRKKLFLQNKKSIPSLDEKIVFGLPQKYRRDIFYPFKNLSKRGEYLVSPIIEILNNQKKIVFIDLFSQIKDDDSVLKERIESEIETFPVEVLFNEINESQQKEFLIKYESIIKDKNFQKLFSFRGILLWDAIESIFQKMKTAPYLPYWLKLVDSLMIYLSKNKPKVIFLPYETGPLALAIIYCCIKNGVKTVGLQHGIIHNYHPSYSHKIFFDNSRSYGFPLPDHMLLFGEISKNILITKGYPSNKLETFGNSTFFYLEKILQSLSEKNLFEKFQLDKNKKIILYLPPAIIPEFENGKQFNYNTQVFKKLIEIFSNDPKLFIILKPHPRDNISYYEKILKESNPKNFRIINGNLLELIYVSSLVISTTSNAILDSLCLKKPVIQVIFDNLDVHMPYDEYESVIKSPLDHLSKNVNQIIDDKKEQADLMIKATKFIKNCYNIPDENPKLILDKIIT